MEKSTVQAKELPIRKPVETKIDHAELPEVWRKFYEQVRLSRLHQLNK